MQLPIRGTPEYLEQVEAAVCITFTSIAIAAMAETDAERVAVADNMVSIVNDLAPLVGEIMHRVKNEATVERLAAELEKLESAGLSSTASRRVRERVEVLRRQRAAARARNGQGE